MSIEKYVKELPIRSNIKMKLIIYLKSDQIIDLPMDDNHLIQSWIYHSISDKLSSFLHDQGFVVNGRSFKLFCFSRIIGNFEINREKNRRIYDGEIQIVISSPLRYFMEEMANSLLLLPKVRLGRNLLVIDRIEGCEETVVSDSIVVQTLSPVTMYSTMLRMDGRKYTVYFEPRDSEYDLMITANLKKKYQAVSQEPLPENLESAVVHVEALGQGRMHVLHYKGFIIKGYMGVLKLSGPQALLQIALDCGLGGKNSQGFGCIEIQKKR